MSASPDPAGQDQWLVFNWQPPASKDNLIKDMAIKITNLGLKQEDVIININLDHPKKPANPEKAKIMTVVNDYYVDFGHALKNSDVDLFAQKYGYLQPTGKGTDGINDWLHDFQAWNRLKIKDYSVSLNEPIVTISGNTAKADIAGEEKTLSSVGESGAAFTTMFYLEKNEGKWKITKVDEESDAEMEMDDGGL